MIRRTMIALGGLLLVGCTSQAQLRPAPMFGAQFVSASSDAVALSIDPPVMPAYPLLGLDRASRERGAFFGYVDSTTQYYYVSTYDEQGSGAYPWCDGYDRLAVTGVAGTVTR